MHYRKFTGLIAGLLVFLAAAGALHAQVLTVTNGLQLWLKADAGVTTNAAGGVTQWTDQSPNGNNAVQTSDVSAPQFVAGAQK